MQSTSVLAPTKFLLCILQLLLVIVIIQVRREFINFSVPAELINDTSASSFKDAQSEYFFHHCRLLACSILFIVTLAVEVVGLLLGLSLFSNQINLLQILLHVVGCILSVWMILMEWSVSVLWGIWAPFG
eukprot:TRINITY_DN3719_c0_g1_i14.p1 TRINITY_DN3719_c0_g1~~TRINITY_DN3719_c0_g1_i14.p1  ORF type:complete len:130 (+),score=25.62 TRINITY_DN3719_c0_g1_i14:165-554(+)